MTDITKRTYTRYDWKEAHRYIRWIRGGKSKVYSKRTCPMWGDSEVCLTQTCFLFPTAVSIMAALVIDGTW